MQVKNKRTMVAILISDKVDIKFKMITRDKKLSLYNDKGILHQGNIKP